jgi:hypothetical protein
LTNRTRVGSGRGVQVPLWVARFIRIAETLFHRGVAGRYDNLVRFRTIFSAIMLLYKVHHHIMVIVPKRKVASQKKHKRIIIIARKIFLLRQKFGLRI